MEGGASLHDHDLMLYWEVKQACTPHLILACLSGRQCVRSLFCLHCKGLTLVDGFLSEAC